MACPREEREKLERLIVGPYGVRAADTRGRLQPEEECEIRTCFQRDVDRITPSKSFRRLKHKTQVFLRPEGDHYRTRLTHTLEVTRLARTVARALGLNEDLAEAIGLGHDLGHTPFGHAGERALNVIYPGGFKHYEQSLRVVDVLERDGQGLNLCYETRMGILNHTYGKPDDTCDQQTNCQNDQCSEKTPLHIDRRNEDHAKQQTHLGGSDDRTVSPPCDFLTEFGECQNDQCDFCQCE